MAEADVGAAEHVIGREEAKALMQSPVPVRLEGERFIIYNRLAIDAMWRVLLSTGRRPFV
jgi:hypothetical protein